MNTASNPPEPKAKYRRTRKLINSRLQLKLTLWFMAVATLTMLYDWLFASYEKPVSRATP